jgi:agmatinase
MSEFDDPRSGDATAGGPDGARPGHDRPRPVPQADPAVLPRYAGPQTFARLPTLDEVGSAAVAVLGVPFDSAVTYRPGARFGPQAIRAGSKLLRPYHPALDVHPFQVHQVADAGDAGVNPYLIGEAIAEIEFATRATMARADRLVTLGGDHTIALPVLRAVRERYGPVALVHFDAHLDTWDTVWNAPFTHATPFRRAAEEGLLALDRSAHVGIRGPLPAKADLAADLGLGFAVVSTLDVARYGVDQAVDRIRARVGDSPVYVSIDVDALDPAHAPGTGTPEAGGLTTREAQMILHGLAGLRLVGADIVEVAPAYDHAEITALAAANLAYDLLALFALDAPLSAADTASLSDTASSANTASPERAEA